MTGKDKSVDRFRHPSAAPPPWRTTVSIRSVQPILAYLAAREHDTAALLRDHKIEPKIFQDPEARLPHTVAVALWEAAGRLTGDADVGLHVAEAIRPGAFGVLDYAVRTSQTLGAGFARLFRYHRLLHDAAKTALEIHRDRAILSHQLPLPGGAPRPVSEFVLAVWLVTSRQATGVDWLPLEVCFPHAEPPDTSEHRRLFAAPLRFGHVRGELVLSRSHLDLPLLKADPVLQRILDEQTATLLRSLPKAEATTDAVRRLLAQELCDGEPTLERIAPRLHLSARTLHRRLSQEGTSFRQILSEVRRELAARYLTEGKLAIGEIAFLLGFSEPSAFHRAFKRWTGRVPLAYRQVSSRIAAVS